MTTLQLAILRLLEGDFAIRRTEHGLARYLVGPVALVQQEVIALRKRGFIAPATTLGGGRYVKLAVRS
ncbi:MAG: hypothetical protein ACRD2R_01400 [Terriglobales bacterium]